LRRRLPSAWKWEERSDGAHDDAEAEEVEVDKGVEAEEGDGKKNEIFIYVLIEGREKPKDERQQ
jgi:hypothetical protein